MSAHTLNHQLSEVDTIYADPGNNGTISPVKGFTSVSLVSAGSEGRYVAAPVAPLQILVLSMLTDGGDVAVDFSTPFDSTGNQIATFNDAKDALMAISVPTATGYRWQVIANAGSTLSS